MRCFSSAERTASQQASSVNDGDAIGEELDFRERVGSEEQSCLTGPENLGFQETAKLGGANGVETARRLIEQENAGLMEESTAKTETLQRAGRKSAHLPVESFLDMKLFRELSDALRGSGARDPVESSEKSQIFPAGESRVEARIASGVIAEVAARSGGIAKGVVSGDLRAAVCGKNQGGENAEQSGFAGAVRSQ